MGATISLVVLSTVFEERIKGFLAWAVIEEEEHPIEVGCLTGGCLRGGTRVMCPMCATLHMEVSDSGLHFRKEMGTMHGMDRY